MVRNVLPNYIKSTIIENVFLCEDKKMKLFQRLLVAPAALGLLSSIPANANEVNLNDISNYSDVENLEFANSFNNDLSTESSL